MKVLHIDSSIFGDASVSRQLSQAIVTQLTAKHSDASVEYLDLATQMIPHLTAEILMGQDAEQAALGEKIIQQYPLITQKDSDLCFKYKQKYKEF